MSTVDSTRCRWTPRSSCPEPPTPRRWASGLPPGCARATYRAAGRGAGKTGWGVAWRGGRVAGPVTSPAFVIAREHRACPAAAVCRGARRRLLAGTAGDVIAELTHLDLETDLDGAVLPSSREGVAERLAARDLLVRLDRRPDAVRDPLPCHRIEIGHGEAGYGEAATDGSGRAHAHGGRPRAGRPWVGEALADAAASSSCARACRGRSRSIASSCLGGRRGPSPTRALSTSEGLWPLVLALHAQTVEQLDGLAVGQVALAPPGRARVPAGAGPARPGRRSTQWLAQLPQRVAGGVQPVRLGQEVEPLPHRLRDLDRPQTAVQRAPVRDVAPQDVVDVGPGPARRRHRAPEAGVRRHADQREVIGSVRRPRASCQRAASTSRCA